MKLSKLSTLSSQKRLLDLKENQLATLTGAGIEEAPLVGMILDVFCKEVLQTENEKIYEKLSTLQFEQIVSVVIGYIKTARKDFLDVFDARVQNYKPLIGHLVVAYLAHLGKISTVATFNVTQTQMDAFDVVFNHFGSSRDIAVYNTTKKHSDNSFDRVDWNDPNTIRLLHWHDLVTNRKDLGVTIEEIASQQHQDSRIKSMKTFYSGIPIEKSNKKTPKDEIVLHNTILSMGTNVGNNFDENLVLNQIRESQQKIFHISHTDTEEQEERSLKEEGNIRGEANKKFNPFTKFHPDSKWISINTDTFLRPFFPAELTVPKRISLKNPLKKIEDWLQKEPDYLKSIVASDLYQKIGEGGLSFEAIKKAEQELLNRSEKDDGALLIIYEMLGDVWHVRGSLEEALKKYQQALDIYIKKEDRTGQAKMINEIANVYQTTGQFKEAIEGYSGALKIFKSLELTNINEQGMAITKANLAFVYAQIGKKKLSNKLYLEAEKILDKLGKIGDLAIIMNKHGWRNVQIGSYSLAQEEFLFAKRYAQLSGKQTALAESFNGLGVMYQSTGQPEEAESSFEKALVIYNNIQDELGILNAKTNVANLKRGQGAYQEALKIYQEVENESLSQKGRLTAMNNQATVYQAMYTHTQNKEYLHSAKELFDQIISAENVNPNEVHQENFVTTLLNRALLLQDLEQFDAAEKDLIEAEKIAKKNELFALLGTALSTRAFMKQNQKQYEKALEIYNETFNYSLPEDTVSVVYNNMGVCFEQTGELKNAEASYRKAIALGETNKLFSLLVEYYTGLSGMLFEQKKYKESLLFAKKAYQRAKELQFANLDYWEEIIEYIEKEQQK